MVLLYMPCCAAIAAIYREVGAAWTLFSACWCTVLGYTSAVIFYRAVNFSAAPVYATVSILLSLAAIVGMYFWMKTFAKKEDSNTPKVIPIHSAH